jgi:hypothetical protein
MFSVPLACSSQVAKGQWKKIISQNAKFVKREIHEMDVFQVTKASCNCGHLTSENLNCFKLGIEQKKKYHERIRMLR